MRRVDPNHATAVDEAAEGILGATPHCRHADRSNVTALPDLQRSISMFLIANSRADCERAVRRFVGAVPDIEWGAVHLVQLSPGLSWFAWVHSKPSDALTEYSDG
jgi:hypothetical protein